MLWDAYRAWLAADDDRLADPVAHSLWVDFFEDEATVQEAWREVTRRDVAPWERRIARVLQVAGPVPWALKAPLLDELAGDPRQHHAVFRALAGSAFDPSATSGRAPRALLDRLALPDDTPDLAALRARLAAALSRAGRAAGAPFLVRLDACPPRSRSSTATSWTSPQAQISVTDDGLLRGDGVFEVMRIYAGRPFGMDEHLERMARSAATLRLPFDADAVRADADRADRRRRARRRRCCASSSPAAAGGSGCSRRCPRRPETIALQTVTYTPTRVLDGVKSLSYAANMLATRLAREQGADEALLVTPHGRVLEGPTTSFFYVLDGALYTPPLSDRILDSITRRALLAVTDAERARHDARRPRGGERGVPGLVAARGAPGARDRRRRAGAGARARSRPRRPRPCASTSRPSSRAPAA